MDISVKVLISFIIGIAVLLIVAFLIQQQTGGLTEFITGALP